MKVRLFVVFLFLVGAVPAFSEVSISQHEDCFRIEIDGKLFTEWQMKAWSVPYLYPVIGPNGENITRNYPMKKGVEGESQDHPHHRSIRFSHRDINGASFWSPDTSPKDRQARIDLVEVKKMESGPVGELIFVNSWKINGEEILSETVRLRFEPLPNREVLMDYDTTLTATGGDATFGDNKDGGMGMRVASTMVVKGHKTKQPGKGTIINSEGNKNTDAWGKRAKWADYSGPGPSGKTVGIAMFDHPENFRHPVHWHARDYGLMTANRFGTGHFEKKQGAKMGDGDYTIKKGETLPLRHRFFFHHGDAAAAGVADQYKVYISGR
ncbi:MAG: PmoA family protein [Verrucomicrobiales bacterium]|nr:PmoA family protein [Verrucomicrobiales bacterium]